MRELFKDKYKSQIYFSDFLHNENSNIIEAKFNVTSNSKFEISGRSLQKDRRVSFTKNPKVIFVENWKILNVDMSKEGKLYSRFNRKRGNSLNPGDKCKVF